MVTLELPAVPASAARARRLVERELGSTCPREVIEIATLLATELVTNVVLHAGTSMRFEVEHRDCVRIEVQDSSPGLPVPRRTSVDATTGRGLLLIERLATAWGVEARPTGKAVWLELDGRRTNRRRAAVSPPG
jgi:anti-sigma regulatory factor (Ser/Thr protein kinase)